MLFELNKLIAKILYGWASTADLFNPYVSEHAAVDKPGASLIRRENLRRYLCERSVAPTIFLLAEAPGPWGCRFSGVPITSEQQLLDPNFPVNGEQSSVGRQPHKEYSASIYWKILEPYHQHLLTWNTVPFHPHYIDKPFSIRTPRVSEIKQFLPLLAEIHKILEPKTVIAVGRKAEKALTMLDIDCVYVRHPSQGGATEFAKGVHQELSKMGITA